MTPEQVHDYLKRSGDATLCTDNLIENEHGFLTWKIHEDKLVAVQVYGDGKYWDAFLNELAKLIGLNKIMMATKRNPKTFERKFGYKVTGHILEKEVV